MNIYFHAIFYIKLYVRVMSARYLCRFVRPGVLQAVGSSHKIRLQPLGPGTKVLVDLLVSRVWFRCGINPPM